MADYQIVCKILSKDGQRIERVGLIQRGASPDRASTMLTTEEVNNLIHAGNTCFFVSEKGDTVEVSRFVQGSIRTIRDGIKHNNLRELRDCRL
jgi:hypothetical protein